jgi:outer membrane protein assembly factor BamB
MIGVQPVEGGAMITSVQRGRGRMFAAVATATVRRSCTIAVASMGLAIAGCGVDGTAPGSDDTPVATSAPATLALGFTWSDSRLVTFDPAAGTIEQVHLQMGPESFIGMAYDPGRHVIHAVSQVDWNLYAIDPATMAASHAGNLRVDTRTSRGEDVQALAYAPSRDVLYGTVVRWEDSGDRNTWRTDLVRIDAETAAVTTIGTMPRLVVSSLASGDDGQLHGLAEGVDGAVRVVRIDPDDATTVELLVTPYRTMLGLARIAGTHRYLTWINADRHFYAEIDLDRATITPLGGADAVGVIAAFVHLGFDAATAPVPRPEIDAAFQLGGQVIAVRDPDDLLDGSIRPGDRLTGRLAYDVNAPYRRRPAGHDRHGFALSIGGAAFGIDSLVARVGNDVFDDRAGTVTDRVYLGATRDGAPGFPVPMGFERISWSLSDATARALTNNDALPVAFDLEGWGDNVLRIEAASDEHGDDGYRITAVIDRITAPGDDGDGADWAQYGRTPRHTSFNPLESKVVSTTVRDLRPVWTCCQRGTRMDVAVWQDQVFVTNADPATELPSPEPFALVSARDAATGVERWAAPLDQGGALAGVVGHPAVGYGRLFAQDENRFFAVSTTTGAFVSAPAGYPGMDWDLSNPVAARRSVYVETTDLESGPSEGRALRAFGEDGAPRWGVAVVGSGRQPAIANQRIWTVAHQRLVAFDLATGNPAGESPPVDALLGSPSIAGGRVYAVAAPATLHVFDEPSGRLLWSAALTGDAGAVPEPPAVDDENVYVATDQDGDGIAVTALDARTGRRRFTTVVSGERSGLLSVAGGIVYVPSQGGELHAIDRAGGRTLATFRFGGPVRTPAVAGGRVFVPTDGAGVTALGLD